MKPEHLNLKFATGDMIKGVGGVEFAASVCRVGKSTLSDAQNPGKPENFLAIDAVFDLEPLARERSGWPHVTRALCAANGGMFVPLPDAPVTREDLLMLLARKARESGELTEAAIACCSNVDDNPAERRAAARHAIKELDEVVAVALEMRVALKSIEREN